MDHKYTLKDVRTFPTQPKYSLQPKVVFIMIMINVSKNRNNTLFLEQQYKIVRYTKLWTHDDKTQCSS